jgi:1-acyl-sn-glycerol-3-phosphate acyltransferase
LTAPTWPTTVPRPPKPTDLGVAYETEWARRGAARVVRAVLTETLTRPAVRVLADPDVAGIDRIAHLDGPVIFAANHASHLDTPLLLSVIPARWRHRTVVAAGADYFFDTRVKATAFALAINAIPIERLRVSRDSANRATALLQEGWSLLIYPEGGRSPDGWGQPHRPGAAWLAQRTGLPLIPVHVEGTGRILPRHSRRPRPGRTQVTFGRPLLASPGGDARDLAGRLERAVAALADEGTTDWWTATRRAARGSSPGMSGPEGAAAWRRTWSLGDRTGRRSERRAQRWPND